MLISQIATGPISRYAHLCLISFLRFMQSVQIQYVYSPQCLKVMSFTTGFALSPGSTSAPDGCSAPFLNTE